MFNKNSMLYKVNGIAKFLGCLSFILLMCLIPRGWELFLIAGIFVFVTYPLDYHGKITIFLFVLMVLGYFCPQFLWIIKFFYILEYIALLVKVIDIEEVRYFLEHSFYKYQSTRFTYFLLTCVYFFKYLKETFLELWDLKESYGFRASWKYFVFVWKRSLEETKKQIRETEKLYHIRFYNQTKKRTYVEKVEWERFDSFYLLLHFLLLGIVFWIGG